MIYFSIPELQKQLALLEKQLKSMQTKKKSDLLYEMAKSLLGQQLIPLSKSDTGCVLAVRVVYKKAFGTELCATASTKVLLDFLEQSGEWKEVKEGKLGDVVIAATGSGNGEVKNGHVCIVGKTHYMSNTSATGLWEANYKPEAFQKWFGKVGGMPVRFFRLL